MLHKFEKVKTNHSKNSKQIVRKNQNETQKHAFERTLEGGFSAKFNLIILMFNYIICGENDIIELTFDVIGAKLQLYHLRAK